MFEELWMEVHNTVQEAVIETTPKRKKCKEAKRLSEEDLPIAEKRRKVKGKGEKERYTHLNAKIERTARGDRKAFLRYQCKEIKGSLQEIRDTKGIFHAEMGTEMVWT